MTQIIPLEIRDESDDKVYTGILQLIPRGQ